MIQNFNEYIPIIQDKSFWSDFHIWKKKSDAMKQNESEVEHIAFLVSCIYVVVSGIFNVTFSWKHLRNCLLVSEKQVV